MTRTEPLHPVALADVAESRLAAEAEQELQRWHVRGRLFIESLDVAIYLLVAGVFVLAALGMLGYSIYAFAEGVHAGFAPAIVALINDLLLVMIMMEVLKTILSYLEDQAVSLRPFLFIGIISATRRVLTVGAAVAIQANISRTELWTHLDDLLVNAGVILALAIAIRLVGRSTDEQPR